MNSIRPISRRKTRKMALTAARPPRASARRASPLISLASAFARSTWARTTRTAAARVALSWAIRPGGGLGAGRALSGLGRSGSSGRPPRGWAVVRETAADHSSARWRRPSSTLAPWPMQPRSNRRPTPRRPIVTAELLAIGTELTVGETTDTNSGELARSLVGLGVPDRPHLEPPRRPRRGRGRAAHRTRPCRPRRHDGRPRSDAGRPDPRGGRGGLRRAAGRG